MAEGKRKRINQETKEQDDEPEETMAKLKEINGFIITYF